MAGVNKPEFAPLLPPGRHNFTLSSLRAFCVEPFDGSPTRESLFFLLEFLVDSLIAHDVVCDVWVDGSFLTEKFDPDDIDLTVKVDEDVTKRVDADGQVLLRTIATKGLGPRLDSAVVVNYPVGHPRRGTDMDRWPYWARYWGVARGGWCKGVAIIRIGENDVGLRLTA